MTANRDLGKLTPIPSVAGQFVWNQATTSWQQVTKTMVGLPLVDNTADSTKPVSGPQQAALDLKAPIASPSFTGGAQVTGNLTVTLPSGSPFLILDAPAGNQKITNLRSGGLERWRYGCSAAAEAGSNSGSDWFLARYSDAGTGISTPVSVSRATGETNLALLSVNGPLRPAQYTLTTLPSASAYTGYEIDVTNATGGSKRCRSNGTAWQILNTTTTVS